jgi:hypothetical protein
MTRWAGIFVQLVVWLACATAAAQAPQPIVRFTLDRQQATVGERVTVKLEVLAPNYLTGPPAFPDLQLHNTVTRALGDVNLTEQHDGITYAGVMREYAIHPQEPGTFAITGQKLGIQFAAQPPATTEATVDLPPLSFTAAIPEAARGIDPFVAATSLTLRQTIDRLKDAPKVGDAITRTVTIEATGTPAMLLPPISLAAADGLAAYPEQPQLQEHVDRRSSDLTATRTERSTYMLQRPGRVVLPPIEVAWWNLAEERIERSRVDSVRITVAANPALVQTEPQAAPQALPARRRLLGELIVNWKLTVLVIVASGAAVWSAPRLAAWLRQWRSRRHLAWQQSEAFQFDALRRVARQGDAATFYGALERWLVRLDGLASPRTAGGLAIASGDAALARQLAALDARLFGPDAGSAGPWSARPLMRSLGTARRRLLRRTAASTPARSLPATLNPGGRPIATTLRPVAR